jgi:hypothetical protein
VWKRQFIIRKGLLFHFEKACGQTVKCLMVPESRRSHVIDVAHAVTGGHFNHRKTRDRIKLSGLTWNTLVRHCKEWVKRCDRCQKSSRVTYYDRIPIQAVPRSTSLFSNFFLRCVWPGDA